MSSTVRSSKLNRQQVIAVLQYELARQPAASGHRLINERQLADLLGANRMTIRRSLNELEEQGILVRRHGSGTYLRKVPVAPPCPSDYTPMRQSLFVTEQATDQPTRLAPDPSRQQLTLGLWGDMHCTTPANRMLLAGIENRTRELNHKLQTYAMEYEADGLTPIEHIVDELKANPCDGYIVNSGMVDRFLKAYHKVWGQAHPPLVQVWPGTILPTFEPLIQADTQQAVERGTNYLIEQGYQRIQLLTMMSHIGPTARNELGYRFAMTNAGLEPMHTVKLQSIMHLSCQWEPVLARLLDEKHRPEAVIMASEMPLAVLARLMKERGLKPGRDMGVLTIANEDIALPKGEDWSRMVFDLRMVGHMAVTSLVDVIVTAGQKLCSFAHQGYWAPGKTHLRNRD